MRKLGFDVRQRANARYFDGYDVTVLEVLWWIEARARAVRCACCDDVAERPRQHWSDEDIVEIMGVIALFGYLNRWNDSMGSALEDLPVQAGE